jgi:3-phenylpropionate/trans-cinnamate dioxygenase ferredoxin component
MTDYADVCALTDIPNGKHRAYVVQGRSVLIFRVETDVYAIENRCTHLDFPLAGGRQIGCEIICRQHGGRFDVRTGKAVGSPAVDPVRTFAVRRAGDRIEIAL